MTGRGVRDRSRRDHPPSGSLGRSNAPPSRHLWLGNLSHSILEPDLTDHFLQFGELESVAFQPGRSYAFINFKNEEDAISAMKALQGFPVAGNPLRIEFAKADKSLTSLHDEDYLQRRDEQRSTVRGSPFSPRDPRAHHASPEHFAPDKSKMNDRSAEPSEVLWIGFPALLKVDEVILRKAFSPFGELEKITVFPGRSYAFVRFRSVISACRAKETLQGKLFGNPRVHICFAKSEGGPSNSGRGSVNAPNSPHFRLNGRSGSSENFLQDRKFSDLTEDASIRSPYMPNFDSGDSDVYSFNRQGSSRSAGSTYEPWRFGEGGPDPRLPQDLYEHSKSPMRFHDFPPKLPQKTAYYEEPWDMPEDTYSTHGTKKLKTGSFPPEKELPEYPLSDLEHEKHAFPRMLSDFTQSEAFDKNFEPGAFGYKQIPDRPMNLAPTHEERNDHWKPSYDGFQVGSGSLQSNVIERKRFTPELDPPSLKEWKWEGTIAKGGTPVCRARCFPVGKVLDIMLPEFLDCTARTGLDMLAKHYYQASSAWVVFFVPESDADMGFYNEFMHYLEEKQRAAVAKLDDKTTLFLVPPSDFSEKVLKVPGKLSISGVVLRLEHSGSSFGSSHPNERKDASLLPFHGDTSFAKPSTPSGPFPSMTSYPELSRSGNKDISFPGNGAPSAPPLSLSGSAHSVGNVSDLYNEHRRDHALQRNAIFGPSWSSHDQQNPVSGARNTPSQVSSSAYDPAVQGHQSIVPRAVQETYSSTGGISGIPLSGNSKPTLQEIKSSVPLSMPISALQPEQLAQLASCLVGQQRQVGNTSNVSMGENFRHTNTMDQSDMLRQSQRYALQNNQATPELSTSQFSQVQQLQQQTSNAVAAVPQAAQRSQQLQGNGMQEEGDADPQKRLQATLQLAAALLQQIQQGKGT
ncbi:PREDICTED: flowering time control protein FPA [Theobroma cacao]|uniref:Flowering time control protein FPA n=1 Tax=Theobroma cacao TaxID=3641 RepID=A0AB32VQ28_THECC|nr:PREDICTED: flowering time control protein FPA [Theobroma cacao]